MAFLAALALEAQPRKLVYGGDVNFSPYEYLDSDGVPQGFNVQLVTALARELAIPVEIRLARWQDTMAALEVGRIDFASLAYTDARAV